MANLSSLSNATTTALSLSNLILVSPQSVVGYQPQGTPNKEGTTSQQPATLLFHYEGEQTVSLESDITDHFVEDNTAINDQIALKPETITTSGFIGELNDVAPSELAPLKFLADKLTAVNAYLPALSASAILAYNEATLLYATAITAADSAISAWSSITGAGTQGVINGNGLVGQPRNQTKQQIAFQQFYGYWKARTLFTVQTPWAIFKNMAIKSLHAVQDAETNVISNFEITFKIMRFANTVTSSNIGLGADFQGRALNQASSLVDLGSSAPPPDIGLESKLKVLG